MIRTDAALDVAEAIDPVAESVRAGLLARPKTLPPWLFYDERGSQLFEEITLLPEYYLTRTERALLERHAAEILLEQGAPVTVVELGAGTATKTGIVLRAAAAMQGNVLYQPIDISPTALQEARANLQREIAGVRVHPHVANYVTETIRVERPRDHAVLAMYIGSSIGNFSPSEAHEILRNLRGQMCPGDGLVLGTDLAPGPRKSVEALVAAYDDAAGVTAEFNRNVLRRLNRELGANFRLDCFAHRARWNEGESRMEMHLESLADQVVILPANSAGAAVRIRLRAGETIHTENSYKFSAESIAKLLARAGFAAVRRFEDDDRQFAVTLAAAIA